MEGIFVTLLGGIIAGGIGALIGRNRKMGAGLAFILCAILGILGWIIVACSAKNEIKFDDMSKGDKI